MVVLDTNIIVALLDAGDAHHNRSVGILEKIRDSGKDILLMDCVLNETYTVLARRSLERRQSFKAVAGRVRKMEEEADIFNAYRYLRRQHGAVVDLMVESGGKLNYHDALIAVIMRSERLRELATFDRDFSTVEWIRIISG